MEQWDRDYIDLEGPGFVKFERGGWGAMRFGAVDIGLDFVLDDKATLPRTEFSFEGTDEMRSVLRTGLGGTSRRGVVRDDLFPLWRQLMVQSDSFCKVTNGAQPRAAADSHQRPSSAGSCG
jgi:hypothetical protein